MIKPETAESRFIVGQFRCPHCGVERGVQCRSTSGGRTPMHRPRRELAESSTRVFDLGDILSVTTGRMLCTVDNIYAILNWMTGDNLFTHQLPRAAEECKGPLLAQHPDLASVMVPDDLSGEDACRAWLATQTARFAKTRMVAPLAADQHARIHPIAEFRMMNPDAQIVAAEVPDGDS